MTFFHHQLQSPLHIKLEKTKLGIQNTCQKVPLASCTIWGHVFDGPLGRLVKWWLSKVGCPDLVLGWFTFVTSTYEYLFYLYFFLQSIRICIFWSLHNGGNESYIRQSQLWDQIICQTKTAKNFLWNWLVILMSCNSLTNFEYEEAFAKPELLKFGKKTSLP